MSIARPCWCACQAYALAGPDDSRVVDNAVHDPRSCDTPLDLVTSETP